jgi:hypothetical protein
MGTVVLSVHELAREMMSAAELAQVVATGKLRVQLKQISRQPGKERWRGRCPFHSEETPSFDVWQAGDKGRYYCQACGGPPNGKGGDAIDWLRVVEGMSFPRTPSNPQRALDRKERQHRELVITEYRNRNPDDGIPDWALDVG